VTQYVKRLLNATEEAFWRALVRVAMSLPRQLDSDLLRAVGITADEYTTLTCLSEASRRELWCGRFRPAPASRTAIRWKPSRIWVTSRSGDR
jgi:hypothetical protein